MRHSQKIRSMPMLLLCTVLVFCCSFNLHAAQVGKTIKPELLQQLLNLAGLDTAVVALDRGDGFETGVSIEGLQDATLLIGFPRTGIAKETPFLLAIDGTEVLVALSEDGRLNVIGGDATFVPAGIDDFVTCVLNAVDEMLAGIDACGVNPICIIGVTFEAVVDIFECIF